MASGDTAGSAKSGYQFGWFKGVYTPSVLTILGVVMYLRFGWVLGNVGLLSTLIIVTLSTAITFLTGLSLAAYVLAAEEIAFQAIFKEVK